MLDHETKTTKLLTDLLHEKHSVPGHVAVLQSKLIKLEISPTGIDRIKNSNLKQYFNDKSLIVYVNHLLLDFLFMSV